MASFSQFASQLSRFPSHETAEYIQPSDLSALTCLSGKCAIKLLHQSNAIKESIEILSQLVTLISNGPQPTISLQYNIVDRLMKEINEEIKQFDSEMPDTYKCTVYISSILGNLSTFSQYIQTLISASAPSLSPYIQNFQDIFQAITTNIDNIVPVFSGVPAIVTNVTKIDEESKTNNRIGALLHLVEILRIILIKFANEETVSKNENTVQSLEQWIEILVQFTGKLYEILNVNDPQLISSTMQTVSTVYPSILDVFNSVKAIDPDCSFFVEATQHVTNFVQFVSQLEFGETYTNAFSSIPTLAQNILSNNTQNLVQYLNTIKASLENRVKTYLYGSLPSKEPGNTSFLPLDSTDTSCTFRYFR